MWEWRLKGVERWWRCWPGGWLLCTGDKDAVCLDVGEECYKLWWCCDKKAGGVGTMVREGLVENVLEVEQKNSEITKIMTVIRRKTGHAFLIYAPHMWRTEEEMGALWSVLDDEVAASEVLLVAGELNCHTGEVLKTWWECMDLEKKRESRRDATIL